MKKDSLVWIQLTRSIEPQIGEILSLRIDNIRQYQPGNYQWLVTPLETENKINLEVSNSPSAKHSDPQGSQ